MPNLQLSLTLLVLYSSNFWFLKNQTRKVFECFIFTYIFGLIIASIYYQKNQVISSFNSYAFLDNQKLNLNPINYQNMINQKNSLQYQKFRTSTISASNIDSGNSNSYISPIITQPVNNNENQNIPNQILISNNEIIMKMSKFISESNVIYFYWAIFLFIILFLYYGIIKYDRNIMCSKKLETEEILERCDEKDAKRLKIIDQTDKSVSNNLPQHVAKRFMTNDTTFLSQYSQSHSCVGVMFAVIPELKSLDLSKKDNEENDSDQLQQLINLQTLLCEIDHNLQNDRFNSLEKIKGV